MLCITRYTTEKFAQHFGDGIHKFYLEFRCNSECSVGKDCCEKCDKITNGPVVQYFRTYNHGKINEPIPDRSHIYGGNYYFTAVKKWGAPPSEIIEFALEYQKEARIGFVVVQPEFTELPKAKKQSFTKEMVRPKKNEKDNEQVPALVPVPALAPVPAPTPVPVPIPTPAIKDALVKRSRKPKVAIIPSDNLETNTRDTYNKVKKTKTKKEKVSDNLTPVSSASEPKKITTPSKKTEATTYSTLVNTTKQLVHKEVSLPTHIESNFEEVDIDGYCIEYVKLSIFEVGQATYFRDVSKNKLYKKIKEKGIGAYVGRWNPDTDYIVTDIPDSDNEN